MIILPPDILPPMPNPSPSDCNTLLSYTNSVISGLEGVLNRLHEVSSYPDEAILLLRARVETMLSEARNMRSTLNSIRAEAINKMHTYEEEQIVA